MASLPLSSSGTGSGGRPSRSRASRFALLLLALMVIATVGLAGAGTSVAEALSEGASELHDGAASRPDDALTVEGQSSVTPTLSAAGAFARSYTHDFRLHGEVLPGTGFPGKSEFPPSCSDHQIIHHVSD